MINIIIDTSMLDTLQLCELKFDRRYNKHLVPPIKSVPLDRGDIIHVAQEEYWKVLRSTRDWVKAVDSALVAFRIAAVKSDLDVIDPMRSKNIQSTSDYIMSILEQNFEFWKNDDLHYEIDAVEQVFSYVLYQDETYRMVMMGKIDVVLSDNRYTAMPMDHKSIDRDFGIKRFQNQFTNYSIATGSPYVLVNRIGLQQSLKNEERFKRVPVSYDPYAQDQWRANTIKWLFRYYENSITNDWPENRTSCDKFNRLCEYYDVCDTSGEEAKIYKLNAFFEVGKPWDVGKVLKSSKDRVEETIKEYRAEHGEQSTSAETLYTFNGVSKMRERR